MENRKPAFLENISPSMTEIVTKMTRVMQI